MEAFTFIASKTSFVSQRPEITRSKSPEKVDVNATSNIT